MQVLSLFWGRGGAHLWAVGWGVGGGGWGQTEQEM